MKHVKHETALINKKIKMICIILDLTQVFKGRRLKLIFFIIIIIIIIFYIGYFRGTICRVCRHQGSLTSYDKKGILL